MKNLGVLSTTLSPWSHWSLSLSKGVAIGSIVVMFFLAACGDDPKVGGTEEDAGIVAIEDKTISGVSQKGPFVKGSAVKLYEMDGESLVPTGKIFPGKIASDDGKFTVPSVSLVSQYALLEANGYFRNEIMGGKSKGIITLNALTDLSDREMVNINLLTHLEYERALYLVGTGVKVSEAKKQAESEILNAFGIKGDFESSEDLDIFSSGDGNAALLAFSVLMLGNLTEADLTERLTTFATDIERDGKWDDESMKTAIADWASDASLEGKLEVIRKNITGWKLSNEVPAFEKYVDNFWWQNYGLGECDTRHEGESRQNTNEKSRNYKKYYWCSENKWKVDLRNRCRMVSDSSTSPSFLTIVRDFSVDHPDFENFSEEYATTDADAEGICNGQQCAYKMLSDATAYGYVGYDQAWFDRGVLHMSCGNERSRAGAMIGVDGNPMSPNPALPAYLADVVSSGPALEYGQCADGQSRNYTNANSTRESIKAASCAKGEWANKVYYTPGMVQSYLAFDAKKADGEYDMYDGVHIQKAADLCDNSWFNQWYKDVEGVNFRMNKTLDLSAVEGQQNLYQVNYNYNNGGYAPLDTVVNGIYSGAPACNPQVQFNRENNTPINPTCAQWGPQSLAIFCPPYDYRYKDGQKGKDECARWKANGGPKSPTAAQAIGANQYLRNHSFTMMGYAKFKYDPKNQKENHEFFEFIGDDDMWIYVDGVLVVDLGGTHVPTPGRVDIEVLAQNNHGCHEGEPLSMYTNCVQGTTKWQTDTEHHLHFFYANRQTTSPKTFMITTSISVLGTKLECK